jgi:hypothetical protein
MSVTSIIDDHKCLCLILKMDALEYNTNSAYQKQVYDQIIKNIIENECKTSEKFGKYRFYNARNHRGDPTYRMLDRSLIHYFSILRFQ